MFPRERSFRLSGRRQGGAPLFHIKVQSGFACWVGTEEHKLVGGFSLIALLGMNILRRCWHNHHVSRFEHALLDEFDLRVACSTARVHTPPALVEIAAPVDANNGPAVVIMNRGHGFWPKASMHQGKAALILIDRRGRLPGMDVAYRFLLPGANHWICHQLSHACCDTFEGSFLCRVDRKSVV